MGEGTGQSATAWRLIVSPSGPGARAMAVDEALLEACASDPAGFVPVLRLYAFEPPCLSLGRFQPAGEVDREACRRLGIDVVRRPSGGRAVLHDRCLTYALIAPVEAAPFVDGIRASAERIGGALTAGLRRLGADLTTSLPSRRHRSPGDCFAVPGAGEVVAGDKKLVGSAQVRRGGAALQHGTIRLRSDAGHAAAVLHGDPDRGAAGGRTALDALCGRPVTFTEAAQAVAAGIAAAFGATLRGTALPDSDRLRAEAIERDRYRADRWTWDGHRRSERSEGKRWTE